ncbi:MAG: hypothetical protein FD143_38 [Ignavibacteria bacterium]|nr:MAG: hypothetical protein FD143_38 [Ignavibacteria bacterium]KAF0158349.1 MAG: hypothetical protein FD188_2607 [Ignavibacteria bacterium]
MKQFVVLFILISFGNYLAQFNEPRISAKKTLHDFGTVVEGQVVSTSFEITNTGSADLMINNVQASCGCTAAQPDKRTLKPGEKTSIKVEFDSANRLGPQDKSVYVMTNDPKKPNLLLRFTCVIVQKTESKPVEVKVPKLKLSKYQHNFGNVEEGKLVDVKIAMQNIGNAVLEIQDVKTTCGCTAALVSSKKLKPGEKGNIRIELDSSNRDGAFTRTVIIYSNDPAAPNQVVTLSANIQKRKK